MTEAERLRTRVRERLAEQRAVVRSLLLVRRQLAGSLFARYGRCGKADCGCQQGEGHGPYHVLSTRSRGRGGFAYLDAAEARRAEALVRRHRDFRQGLRRLRTLNLEVWRLLQRYREATAREGGRTLRRSRPRGQRVKLW